MSLLSANFEKGFLPFIIPEHIPSFILIFSFPNIITKATQSFIVGKQRSLGYYQIVHKTAKANK